MKIRSSYLVRIGFACALLIFLFIGFLSYRSTRALIHAWDQVTNSHEVIEKLDELLLKMSEAESAVRGYVMAGREFYLGPYEFANRQIDQTITELDQLIAADSPNQGRRIDALKPLIAEKHDLQRQQIRLRQSEGFRSASKIFLTGRGRVLMDEMRTIVTEVKEEERRVLKQRTALAQQDAEKSTITLLIGSVFSFAILAAIFLNLNREIGRRAHSEARLTDLNRLYAALSQTNQAIVRIRDKDALFREVCRIAVEHGLLRMAWVGLVDTSTGLVKPAAHWGVEEGYLDQLRISVADEPEGRGPTGSALREARHFVCNDIETDPRLLPWREEALKRGYRSSAAFPLQVHGKVVGGLTVYAADRDFFDDEIVTLLDEITVDLSFALETIEKEEQRKRAEEEVKKLNEDLERRIAERTEQVAEANTQLELRNEELARASRMKSDFLAGMSHELRTPLNAITGFSDLLAEESAGPLNDKQRRFVGHIQKGSQHLLKLINEVLDLSKIEAGRVELNYEHFPVVGALGEVLSTTAPLASAKGIEVENRIDSDLLVCADRVRLKQILYNLLSNAVKFTPERGRVWLEARIEGDFLRISVCDTGIGIAPSDREAIFEEFHQVGTTTKGVKEGTGLGLAITKRLVERHGGEIHVESEPGQGSQVTFTLPLGHSDGVAVTET